MGDNAIIDLYFKRSKQAIVETDTKCGGYYYSIAYGNFASGVKSLYTISKEKSLLTSEHKFVVMRL